MYTRWPKPTRPLLTSHGKLQSEILNLKSQNFMITKRDLDRRLYKYAIEIANILGASIITMKKNIINR